MRAMVLDRYGLTPHVAAVPVPEPGAGQVRVRVRAASVNPIDWKQASGMYRPILRAPIPGFVPGYDIAGEVDALGPGVSDVAVGHRVHARIAGASGGASAEYAIVGADMLAAMPGGMDFAQAAGLPLAGMTALQGLRDVCGVPLSGATQRVLVIGASGGVGHLAVQIARAAGATVTGVCSGRNTELVRSLGAHAVVDYTRPALPMGARGPSGSVNEADAWEGVGPFDAILDCVGQSPGDHLARLAPGGCFAGCVPGPAVFLHAALNPLRSRAVRPVILRPNAADLAVLDGLFAEGRLRVAIDGRYPLEDLAAAWERSRSGRVVGKVVIDVA